MLCTREPSGLEDTMSPGIRPGDKLGPAVGGSQGDTATPTSRRLSVRAPAGGFIPNALV